MLSFTYTVFIIDVNVAFVKNVYIFNERNITNNSIFSYALEYIIFIPSQNTPLFVIRKWKVKGTIIRDDGKFIKSRPSSISIFHLHYYTCQNCYMYHEYFLFVIFIMQKFWGGYPSCTYSEAFNFRRENYTEIKKIEEKNETKGSMRTIASFLFEKNTNHCVPNHCAYQYRVNSIIKVFPTRNRYTFISIDNIYVVSSLQ